jgi:hypothetical protein
MSFERYLNSIGARPQSVYGSATRQMSSDGGGYYTGYGKNAYNLGDKPKTVKPTRYASTPYSAYVDNSGGFLGYGRSFDDLRATPGMGVNYNEYVINDQDRIARQERESLANQQSALDLQQRREAIRAATINNPQFAGTGLVGMGQQGMAPQQFGRAAVPGMGRGTGQGIGRGTGQGLLGGLHRGAAPTGGGQ